MKISFGEKIDYKRDNRLYTDITDAILNKRQF